MGLEVGLAKAVCAAHCGRDESVSHIFKVSAAPLCALALAAAALIEAEKECGRIVGARGVALTYLTANLSSR